MNSLQEQFSSIRSHTEYLCSPLEVEDYVPQPIYYVSPPKWHLGHTTWFFEEFLLKPQLEGYQEFHPDFSFLFNSYYNTVGERVLRAERGNLTRPIVEEVYAYRKYVNENMLMFLERELNEELLNVLQVGMNHEQQHQELLLTDLKYTLGHNPLFPVYRKEAHFSGTQNQETGFVQMKEGIYEIGHTGEEFCYDNEMGRHKVYLHAYEISKAQVTNGEFLEFMQDGGYERFDLWLDEGWYWRNENEIVAPMYWHKIDNEWHNYTFGGLKKVNPDDVLCHISFYEAAAFAEWKGMRLPTEFEWEAACHQLKWGNRWEWTNSAYLPYPGFDKPDGAIGEYNGKFMVNQMVLRGASTVTPEGHSRPTYRNFFHPNFRWQFNGIRLAKK